MRTILVVLGVMFLSSLIWLIRNWDAKGPTDVWNDEDIDRARAHAPTELGPPRRPDPHLKQPLIEVGYWASEQDPHRPDPRDFVDPTWDPKERDEIRAYLAAGSALPWEQGPVEFCSFCRAILVAEELTDGTYVWPTGLLHYVDEHSIRLPGLFVLDVQRAGRDPSRPQEAFVELDRRESNWWDSLTGP